MTDTSTTHILSISRNLLIIVKDLGVWFIDCREFAVHGVYSHYYLHCSAWITCLDVLQTHFSTGMDHLSHQAFTNTVDSFRCFVLLSSLNETCQCCLASTGNIVYQLHRVMSYLNHHSTPTFPQP